MSNDNFDSLIFSAELDDTEIPVLDVHGYTQDQAKREIEDFLCREHARGKRGTYLVVKIITGTGGGKLQLALKEVLEQKILDFVEFFRYQEYPITSTAVTFLVLAPNK